MKDRLLQLIETEDKKNPYTDEQLASMLNIRRDSVTVMRSELDIPDSRERRKPYLLKEIQQIILQNPNISTRQLTKAVNKSGFDVSRYLIAQIVKELKGESSEVQEEINDASEADTAQTVPRIPPEPSAFNRIIGYDGSLKPQIQQAKAAILYPPNGLHTLIVGPTGVGKSNLAEAMYEFAIETGTLNQDAPFIIFNCADYAENPQLLLSQLFGHVKGAYTGAVVSKEGLVEKADGGILFLDEVHRLPPEGQELLYYLMDKGKFRRMGETETERTANVLIIAATTADIESSLLLTFRRRIPMIIELPPLAARPLHERFQTITNFFNKEADRIGVKVKVTQQALRALLLYDCPGNIGQLRSDIQVACARGFLTYVGGQKQFVEVDLIDLPVHVRRGLLKIQNRRPEVENLLEGDLVARPGQVDLRMEPKEDLYTLPGEIYQYIEERFQELELQGLSQDVINRLIGGELEVKFQQLIKRVESSHQTLAKKDLEGIVGKNIVDMAEKVTEIAKKRLGRVDKHLFYCLAVHLSATLERIQKGKPIVNPQLEKVMREYKLEYSVAKEMVKQIEVLSGYKIPQDEIGFIAMYLRTITKPSDVKKGRVGIVVLSHGRVAQGMAEVANRLLGVNHAVGVEMSLDEKPESALQRTIEVVSKVDEGKGVLLLVDMGSLITFGEIITKQTGIPTRTVVRVDTVMVLEALRRAILPDTTLDEIADSIDKKDEVGLGRFIPSKISKDKNVILTLCITGEGTAMRIKNLIEKMLPGIQEKIQIIPMGIMDDEDITERIDKIKEKYNVSAIVGSIDPKSSSIPFISLEEIIQGQGIERLKSITDLGKVQSYIISSNSVNSLANLVCRENIIVNPNWNTKEEVLDQMVATLLDNGFVKEQFLLDIYKREAMGPAILEGIAIPHGRPENVIKPTVGIAIFKDPIPWWDQMSADCVFMLALNEDSKDIIRQLFKLIKDKEFIRQLKNCSDASEVRNSIIEFVLANN